MEEQYFIFVLYIGISINVHDIQLVITATEVFYNFAITLLIFCDYQHHELNIISFRWIIKLAKYSAIIVSQQSHCKTEEL